MLRHKRVHAQASADTNITFEYEQVRSPSQSEFPSIIGSFVDKTLASPSLSLFYCSCIAICAHLYWCEIIELMNGK